MVDSKRFRSAGDRPAVFRLRRRRFLPLLLLYAAASVASEGEVPSIRHARFGTAVDARNRSVMPLTVSVVNPGPALEVELSAHSPGAGSGQRFAVRRTLVLPASSLTRVTFPFHADVEVRPGARAIQPVVDLELGDGRRVRWSRYQTIGRVFPEGGAGNLVVDGRGAGYPWMEASDASGEAGAESRFLLQPYEIPRSAASLSFADVVVLGSPGAHRFDSAQVDALTEWIAAGGVAVVVPAPGFEAETLGLLEARLPGAWMEGARSETLPLPDGSEAVFADSGGIWRAPLRARAGADRVGPEEDPLALVGRHGRGCIVMLGFDAGDTVFQEWTDASAVWRAILAAGRSPDVPRGGLFAREPDRVQELMRRMAGASVASQALILTYLAVLLGGFVLLLAGGHAVGRPEWGWIGSLVFAILAGFTLLGMTRRDAPERAGVLEVAYARLDPDGNGLALEGSLGFFAVSDTVFHAVLADDRGFVAPGRTTVRPVPAFPSAWEGGRQVLGGLPVRSRALRHAVGFARRAAPDVPTGRLVFEAAGARVDVDVSALAGVDEAFLRWRRLVIPLAPQALDGTAGSTLRPDSRAEGFRYSTRAVLREADELRGGLRDLVFRGAGSEGAWPGLQGHDAAEGGPADADAPAVYLFSSASAWPLDSVHPESDRHALVLWRLPLRIAAEDGRIVLPRGILPRRLAHRGAMTVEHPDGPVSGYGGAELVFVFSLPPELPALAVESMRLFFEGEGDGYAFEAEILPGPGSGAVALARGVTRVDPPASFVPGAEGIRVRVKVTETGEGGLSRRRPWTVGDLELEVEGRQATAPEGRST